MSQKRVVVVAYPDCRILAITGPVEVLDTANRLLDEPDSGYRIEFVSPRTPQVSLRPGVMIAAAELDTGREPIDTLLIPGGRGLSGALEDRELVSWIGRAAERSRRVVSVCGGAFLLAEAGLLDGRRATTHWAYCSEMAHRYPNVTVDPKPVFVSDGPFVTSAGASTGIDMSLALVEEDYGAALALEVTRSLVLFFKRHGGQAQFSSFLDAQLADHVPVRIAQEWILENLEHPLSVADMAEQANMSPRNFARVFRREVGTPPAHYVERMRIARARELLETTGLTIRQVATRCGFSTPETFLRSFGRLLELTPGEYRQRFQSPGGLVPRPERVPQRAEAGSVSAS